MGRRTIHVVSVFLLFAVFAIGPAAGPVYAADRVAVIGKALQSVVSVLPLWPGQPQGGGADIPAGAAPEGTGVVLDGAGHIATALHVVERSLSVSVRLPDGRILPAALIAGDLATDIAVLKINAVLPAFEEAGQAQVGQSVCAIGNAFGFDLSVTCGIVSATRRTGMGFNAIEDFVQTDAAMNPGSSGGALIDDEGRLVGMLSAIITKESDADAGFNLAVSQGLLRRVTGDLIAAGKVDRSISGIGFAGLSFKQRADGTGVLVRTIRAGGAGDAAGLRQGDIVQWIDGRRIDRPTDAMTALYLRRPGEAAEIAFKRQGNEMSTRLVLNGLTQ
ncbi:PDZ domain-containing protein [Hwanghaeella grinnelliae]|uniref:PDZ domain-containing protein n=1 Tax=Hwanghaeella grinnelliae TaxID=2500179 RepID=A0A437QI32_9PROT|nr:trypsin-like peptidase domain-containing protein [Hwanghaeella grinnelliae]RVU34086.1 PDZ domain-containing protein [Hwanghaeella grinnelliae]